jgi:NAD(P)-dependent dehydrogenase (short-subunit alcohol dehydrogenase family)
MPPKGRYRFAGRVALVTGAASGIGRALAIDLADRGCHLALCDINLPGLAETAALAQRDGLRISQHRLDVSDRAAVKALPSGIKDSHGGLDLLFNNAGVALTGSFEQLSEDHVDWLLNINLRGLIDMTRAFLPVLHASDDAMIVNTSSIFGLLAPPLSVPYSTSKFAVTGFSHTLRRELAATTVGVMVVHPGGVATNIATGGRMYEGISEAERKKVMEDSAKALTLAPSAAVKAILDAATRRQARVLVGRDAKMAAVLQRLFPTRYWELITRLGLA